MARMDLTLTGTTFTDTLKTNVGSSAFRLDHDYFTKQDLVIRTAAAGGGTLLVEDVDFTLGSEDEYLSAQVSTAVGSGRNVFLTIQVTTVAYQTGNLYFSGKYIADAIEAADVDYRTVKTVTHTSYTVLDADGYGVIEVDPSSFSSVVTLPTLADNQNRVLDIVNRGAATAAEVQIDGEGAEAILWPNGGTGTVVYVAPGQNTRVRGESAGWRIIGGFVNPIATQPGWGFSHTQGEVLVDTDPTTTDLTLVTCSSVPTGARGIYGYFRVLSATTAGRVGSICDAGGATYASTQNPTTAIYGYSAFKVPLNASKQMAYVVNHADVSAIYIVKRGYYL